MAKKVKFDMNKIAEVADQLIAAKGTSTLKNKVIREFAGTKGLDEYTIWRTFLLPEYKTTQKGVYDVSPLANKTEMQELLEEISAEDTDYDLTDEAPISDAFNEWSDINEDEDEDDEDIDETKTVRDLDSDFFAGDDYNHFDAMDYIGDAYNEYSNSMDMD